MSRNTQLEVTKAVAFAEDSHHDARCLYLDGEIRNPSYFAVVEALAAVRAVASSGAPMQEQP